MPELSGAQPARGKNGFSEFGKRFWNFWISRCFSYIGDGVALIALLLYVKRTQQSGLAVALLLMAQSVPRLAAPVAGAVADRVELRRFMISLDIAQAGVFALIAMWLPPLSILLVLVAISSLFTASFSTASKAAVPELVPADQLLRFDKPSHLPTAA
jgi:MFS family permease